MRTLFAVAWRNLWRHRRRSLITATAMAVGVGLCMASIAYTDGTYRMIFDVLVDQQLGHVQVHHPDYPGKRALYDTVADADATLARLDQIPGCAAVSGRLFGYALLGGPHKSTGVQLIGVDPARERAVTKVWSRVRQGAYLAEGDDQGVLLGADLARDLGLGPGDEVVVVTQSADGSMGNALYTVRGLVRSGNTLIDNGGAYLSLAALQDLLVLPDQVHEFILLSQDPDHLDAFAAAAQQAAPDALVQTWEQASPQTAQMLALQDVSVGIILAVVFSVAAFGVLNTMMMSVFERTRELGVLKAIGMRPGRLVGLIVMESFFLASLAAGIGLLIGGALDAWLVVYGLDFSGSLESMDFMGVSIDPVMKGEVRPLGVVITVASVFVVSILASLWPALRAARLEPVEAIRSE